MASYTSVRDIKQYDCIRHSSIGKVYAVKEIVGDKLYLLDAEGHNASFMFSPQFGPATEEEAAPLDKIVIRMQIKSTAKPAAKKTEDPEKVKSLFKKYTEELQAKNAEAAGKFAAFWTKLMEIVGDEPGATWTMRDSKKLGLNPVIKAKSKKTENYVNLAHVWGGDTGRNDLCIMLMKAYISEQYKALFPVKKGHYGTGDSVELKYADLDGSVGETYFNCFKAILHPDTFVAEASKVTTAPAQPESEAQAAPEPQAEAAPEPQAEAAPEPQTEAAPEPTPEPQVEAAAPARKFNEPRNLD